MLPWPLRQLSLFVVEPLAKAEPATATVAISIAILFNLIILSPKSKLQLGCGICTSCVTITHRGKSHCATDVNV
jgi:hypothetical protein